MERKEEVRGEETGVKGLSGTYRGSIGMPVTSMSYVCQVQIRVPV